MKKLLMAFCILLVCLCPAFGLETNTIDGIVLELYETNDVANLLRVNTNFLNTANRIATISTNYNATSNEVDVLEARYDVTSNKLDVLSGNYDTSSNTLSVLNTNAFVQDANNTAGSSTTNDFSAGTVIVKDVDLTNSAVTRDFVLDVAGAGSLLEYFHGSVTSSVAAPNYYLMTNALGAATAHTNIISEPTNNQYLVSYVSESGTVSRVAAGSIIETHIHAFRSGNPSASISIKPELYVREADGTETNEIEDGASFGLTTTETPYSPIISVTRDVDLAAGDRLVIKYKVTAESGTADAYLVTEGTTGARANIPAESGTFLNTFGGPDWQGDQRANGYKITGAGAGTAEDDYATFAQARNATILTNQIPDSAQSDSYASTSGDVVTVQGYFNAGSATNAELLEGNTSAWHVDMANSTGTWVNAQIGTNKLYFGTNMWVQVEPMTSTNFTFGRDNSTNTVILAIP